MSEESGLVRRLAWRELCPWLMLFRSFRLAVSVPILLLATVGAVLTPCGWYLAGEICGTPQAAADSSLAQWPGALSLQSQTGVGIRLPGDREAASTPGLQKEPEWSLWGTASGMLRGAVGASTHAYWRFVGPFLLLRDRYASLSEVGYYLIGAVWTIVVWSFLAGAITRIAAVELGREERISLNEALSHARKNYGWYVATPFFPLMGIVCAATPIVILGLLMRWLDLGVLLAGLVWPLVLLCGVVVAVLLLGFVFSWPLMWPTISSEENGDAFEAFSRSFSYIFQRPLHYLFYGAVAAGLFSLCWLLVNVTASAVVESGNWAAAWGAGNARMHPVLSGPALGASPGAGAEQPAALPQRAAAAESGVVQVGSFLIRFWVVVVRTIAVAFNDSFFWCAATAIYLLMRRDVDQTDFDEVFVEGEEERYSLPPLKSDASGVPSTTEAAEKPAETTTATAPAQGDAPPAAEGAKPAEEPPK